jgi:hypothetical protein
MHWWNACCLGGWHRWICIADNLNHAALRRFRLRRLCDLHDQYIHSDFDRDVAASNERRA